MIYLLFVLISIASVALIETVAARFGVIDLGEKVKIYKPTEDEGVVPFRNKSLILITMICLAVVVAVQISLYINAAVLSFIKLYGVLLIVLTSALIDYKRRIIPNRLIIVGLIFRVCIYVYEIFGAENIKLVLFSDLLGFCIGFVFLGLISIVSRGSLGFGDAKLFGIIGITTGALCTYSTLLASLVVSVVVSVVSLIMKKMGRRDSFPFGPCIALGYIITVLLVSY